MASRSDRFAAEYLIAQTPLSAGIDEVKNILHIGDAIKFESPLLGPERRV